MAGALAFACVCAAGSIPARAAEAKEAPETSAVEQIWQEVVEEYGLKQEETELVYQTDAMGRSTQGPEAVKSETVDEEGFTEVTYYVPYVMDEEEDELVNSFEYWEAKKVTRASTPFSQGNSDVILSATATYSTYKQNLPYGNMGFVLPASVSGSWKKTSSGDVDLGKNAILYISYDLFGNLYSYPSCLTTDDVLLKPTYKNYSCSATINQAYASPNQTYFAYFSTFPSGSVMGFTDGVNHNGGINMQLTYYDKSGNMKKAGMYSLKFHG